VCATTENVYAQHSIERVLLETDSARIEITFDEDGVTYRIE